MHQLNPELGCQLAFDLVTGELISVSSEMVSCDVSSDVYMSVIHRVIHRTCVIGG